MRRLAVLAAALVVLLAGQALEVRAAEGPGSELADACGDAGLDDRLCASVDAGTVLTASLCEDGGAPAEACAGATDGVAVTEARIAAYEAGWVHRALRLQSRLDAAEPLRNTLWPHTHNSANSTAYAPSVSSLDPNQRWPILDQLRMGIRAVELDLHPDATGTQVVLCHGEPVDLEATVVHAGCSVDRTLGEGLAEIADFLGRPGNEREVVLLYLENVLDGVRGLHDQVGDAIAAAFGDLVARPPADEPCAPMPLERSRADLLAEGHRVLIVGNCGPGSWGSWVHVRGERWHERGLGDGFDCATERSTSPFDTDWIRIWEDSTWLSAMASGTWRPQTADDVRAMVACGVDMIGFDRIDPDDGRLEALVWSWAPGEPAVDPARDCVAYGADARFRAVRCLGHRGYACRTPGGRWVVPDRTGPAARFDAACAAVGAAPATPPTGHESGRLAAVAAGRELWLPLANPA